MTQATITKPRVPQWTIGDRLRKARHDAGLSQAEMAASIGVSIDLVKVLETRPGYQVKFLYLVGYERETGAPMWWLAGQPEGTVITPSTKCYRELKQVELPFVFLAGHDDYHDQHHFAYGA